MLASVALLGIQQAVPGPFALSLLVTVAAAAAGAWAVAALRTSDGMTHALTGRDGCVRCKDAGSVASGAIDATEDAAARVHNAFRRPVLIRLEVHKR